jgi:hypothetical protein
MREFKRSISGLSDEVQKAAEPDEGKDEKAG